MQARLRGPFRSRWGVCLTGFLILTSLIGCTHQPVTTRRTIKTGDRGRLNFTCYLDDGKIIATTEDETAESNEEAISNAFVPLKSYLPATITIGEVPSAPPKPELSPMINEIVRRISGKVAGFQYGVPYHLEITSQTIENLPESERTIRFSRTMHRPKKGSISKTKFVKMTGKAPKIGDIVLPEAAIQWKVTGIKEDRVEVRYLASEGMRLKLVFGEAVIRDRGDNFDMEIDAREGNLVRIGPYVGRISDVDERLFTVDFSHPFGGKNLTCEIIVDQADQQAKKK